MMKKPIQSRRIRGVIFDIDGTLIDSNAAHAHAYMRAMAEHGFPEVPFERILALIGMGGDKLLPAAIGISHNSTAAQTIEKTQAQIFRQEYIDSLQPTPGAANLVSRLQMDGLRLVVATSGKPHDARELLKRIGVAHILTAMASSADVEDSKPDPDIIGVALKLLGLPAEAVLLLGDTPYDVQAGVRAGVGVIALRSGGWNDDGLAGAIAIFDDPADLLTHLPMVLGTAECNGRVTAGLCKESPAGSQA